MSKKEEKQVAARVLEMAETYFLIARRGDEVALQIPQAEAQHKAILEALPGFLVLNPEIITVFEAAAATARHHLEQNDMPQPKNGRDYVNGFLIDFDLKGGEA